VPGLPRWAARPAVRNTGGQARRIITTPMAWTRVQALLATANQNSLNSNGAGFVTLACTGLGTKWYVSQVQVSTGQGPSPLFQIEVTVYLNAVNPVNVIGRSAQGGGDTIGVTVPMQQGDQLIAVWAGAAPNDTATLAVSGDQEVLT